MEGVVFVVGADVCGMLGVSAGGRQCVASPVQISAFSGKINDIACGARHSAAVGEKGQVFTWGSAQYGQLGHGRDVTKNSHQTVWDPRTGEYYEYIQKPATVQALFGAKIYASRVACGAFSTHCLTRTTESTTTFKVYSWGNDSDGQCAAQARPDDVLSDPLLRNSVLSCHFEPRESAVSLMTKLAAAGSTVCGVDGDGQIWSWGRKKLHRIEALQSFVCQEVDVGDSSQCVAMCSLYLLEVTGDDGSAFCLLALPADSLRGDVQVVDATLLHIGLPFHESTTAPILDPAEYPAKLVQQCVLLVDRALAPGQWLKLATTDFDFALTMAPMSWAGTFGDVVLLPAIYDVEDIKARVCVFEVFGVDITTEQLTAQIWGFARTVTKHSGVACLVILPSSVATFELEAPPADVTVPTGVMLSDIGKALRLHLSGLAQLRLAENPKELDGWVKRAEHGVTTYIHESTGKVRNAPPLVETSAKCTLVRVKEDISQSRLKALVALQPKGIVYCQPSWQPDCELLAPSGNVPIAVVPYEAGEELKCMIGAKGPDGTVAVSFKMQTGGVFSWNEQRGEMPKYEKNLHDYQVRYVACGSKHTVAVTERGDVFSWNQSDATPALVEQVEGLAKASKVFAGADQTFVLAELPFHSILH